MAASKFLASVIIAFGGANAFAGTGAVPAPPDWPDDLPGDATLKKQPAIGVRMGRLFVEFERTTLGSVLRSAGAGVIGEWGQDGGRIRFVCFTDATSSYPVRLWLISSVMSGPDFRVTELNAVALHGREIDTEGCPRLPKQLAPTALDRGIWVGTTRTSLIEKLGRPSGKVDGWLAFNFHGKLPGPYQGPGETLSKIVSWDVMSVVSARLANDRVASLRAVRITSY